MPLALLACIFFTSSFIARYIVVKSYYGPVTKRMSW